MLIQTLIDKFDGQLPSRRYDTDGEELFSSKLRRAAHAQRMQNEAEKADPRLKAEREQRMRDGDAEERKRRAAEHEERFWAEMPRALREMGLCDQELEAVAGMNDAWPTWQTVSEWAEKNSSSLVLGGDPGTGKTIAAARLLGEQCKEHFSSENFAGWFWRPAWGRFVKATGLARLSYYHRDDREWLERLGFTKWLIIDDVGAEHMSEGWAATFSELIDTRARNRVRTVVTTNLSGKEFTKRYEGRVMRRLTDFGVFAAAKKPETL